MPTAARLRADACPGVFAPHDAADGALARVRLPGGVVTAGQLRVLAGCATDLGDGAAHLTSRGNLQLRGLDRADPALVQRLTGAGLLPSMTHEKVRNVLASPLSGIRGGRADVRGLAARLDHALCSVPALADLSGRFLFALDDGRGDVAAEQPDLCWQALDTRSGRLLVAGSDTGVAVPITEAVTVLLRAAEAFLQVSGTAWRAHELPGVAAHITAEVLQHGRARIRVPEHSYPLTGGGAAIGPVPRDDGGRALGAAPRLGELSASQLRLLVDLAPETVVTPWRTVLLPDPAPDAAVRLAAAGLVVDPDDPAIGLSACAGRPGCAKALADVRADAPVFVGTGRRVHVSGCERRCGAPHAPHVDVVATTGGYLVDGMPR